MLSWSPSAAFRRPFARGGCWDAACHRLGDLDGIATASWDLAQIDLEREDYRAALSRLTESFRLFGQLQQPAGITIVGLTLGELLLAMGQDGRARQVLTDSAAAAARIGWTDAVQQISRLLNP